MPESMTADWLREHLEDRDWYKVEAKTSGKTKSASVYIFDEISMWGTSARGFIQQIKALKVDRIDLHLNSPGGSYFDGAAIMNSLREHEAKVTVTVDGVAASAASVIAMAGDEIVMAKGSQMMIHNGKAIALGGSEAMRSAAQMLEGINKSMSEIYAERSDRGTPEDWAAMMTAETWFTAQEAVDAGLADRLDTTAKEEDVAAAAARFDLTAYAFAHAGRDKAPAPHTPPAEPEADPNKEGDGDMPVTKELVEVATALGVKDADKLPDNAAVKKAIDDKRAADVKAEADAKAAAEAAAKGNEGGDAPETSSVKLPPGMTLLDTETVNSLQAAAQRSDAVVKKYDEKERDDTLAKAVTTGKIPAGRLDHWKTYWDSDKEGAKAALAQIPDNLVPVTPTGYDDGQDVGSEYRDLYPEGV